MSSIFDDIKHTFGKQNNGLAQLIVANIAVFSCLVVVKVLLFLGKADAYYWTLLNQLRLPAALTVFALKPWTIVTYFFAQDDVLHLLFNMLFLYWFGKIIAEYLGNQRLLNLYFLGGLSGGITYLLLYNALPYFQASLPTAVLLGASGAVFAIIAAAATLLPNYTFFLLFLGPVRIKYIALFYLILSWTGSVGPNAGGNIAHLGGALLGFMYIKFLRKGIDLGTPIETIGHWSSYIFVKKVHRKGRILQFNPEKKYQSLQSIIDIAPPNEAEIDTILDKINKSGYESLSFEEKQKLFQASDKK